MKKLYLMRGVKILSLCLAVLLAVSLMQGMLFHPRERDVQRMRGFRLEERDSLDVVFLGASELYTGFSSARAWELQGFTSYPYALAACPVTYWRTMLDEVLTLQSPQLVVVELNGVTYEKAESLHSNPVLHYLLDEMPLSGRKLRALREHSYAETDPPAYFLFPILKYHNMWPCPQELEANYRDAKLLRGRGYALLRGVSQTPACHVMPGGVRSSSEMKSELPMAEEAEEALQDFLACCRARKVNVLFVRFPHQAGKAENDRIYRAEQITNSAERMIRESGFPVLNLMRMSAEIGIDPDRDFYNQSHLNIRGQMKVTAFLAGYLVEECGVTPRPQTAENIAGWEASREAFRLYSEYVEEEMLQRPRPDETVTETAELINILDLTSEGERMP